MDEKKRKQTPATEKKKNDYFMTVTTVQIAVCAILCLVVFALSKTNSSAGQKLKNDFQNIMNWSLEKDDVQDAFAYLKDYLEASPEDAVVFGAEKEGDSQALEAASEAIEETTEESTTAESTTEQTTSTEPTTKAQEKKADKKTSSKNKTQKNQNGVGGEDVTGMKATDNTSFSPVAVTAPIVKPVSGGRYSSYFGYRTNPITNEYSFHTGLDIAAPEGSKIKAAYDGQVRAVGEDSHSGKYIAITHSDGFETVYCHCSKILAEKGAVIRQGETIALVGSTGWSTGPHLHFEVRKNKKRLNPLPILNGNDS